MANQYGLVAATLMLAALTGCAATPNDQSGGQIGEQERAENRAPLLPSALFAGGAARFESWQCQPANQNLVTAQDGETLRLWSLYGAWKLPQARVASGARYQDSDIGFWERGERAQVEAPRGQLQCEKGSARSLLTRRDHPEVMFFARGNEPGWSIALHNTTPSLHLVTRYGEEQQTRPYVISVMDNAAGRVVLENVDGDDFFRVRIEAAACFDDMSGEPFPARVTLSLNGEQLSGCGQGIAP